ncbi:ABC transporter permease subunit [Embleya sp. NPDC008237]|uniref:ABC transporter permease subunit n=1 Tax=Embleya sp. NPDC008237 TaxID=3363978 RepID=UPI0036E85EFF
MSAVGRRSPRLAVRPRVLLPAAAACLLVAFVVVGPALTPYDPAAPVGAPWTPAGGRHVLGTDVLGRDVLSRAMTGGHRLLAVGALAAACTCLIGTAAGLIAAGGRPGTGYAVDLAADLLIAVPALLPALLLAAVLPGTGAVIAATVVSGAPLTARIVADAATRALASGYVRAARLRAERSPTILVREVLPSMSALLAADFGLRFVTALQLSCALGVLGLGGTVPPSGDWAAMLRENLPGATLNPAALAAPAVLITALALAVAGSAHTAARAGTGSGLR